AQQSLRGRTVARGIAPGGAEETPQRRDRGIGGNAIRCEAAASPLARRPAQGRHTLFLAGDEFQMDPEEIPTVEIVMNGEGRSFHERDLDTGGGAPHGARSLSADETGPRAGGSGPSSTGSRRRRGEAVATAGCAGAGGGRRFRCRGA